MTPRSRRHARNVALGLLLLALAAWLLPSYFSAERYRRRLVAGLTSVLHRDVSFGAVSFRLLPRPGFSIENVVVEEDPAFGSEPFAHVDRIEIALRWHSLWRKKLDFAHLSLIGPSVNLVRSSDGEWNVERLLRQSGMAAPPATFSGPPAEPGPEIDFDVEDGRLNFKVGEDKKPFAVTDVSARVSLDAALHRVRFRISGNPIRTDLSLPTPGAVELSGAWTPGPDLTGPLQATLRTRGALLYDWVPILTGRNPEIYGVFDTDFELTGSLRVVKFEGDCRLNQLHRWEELPPSQVMPWRIHFRGVFDRPHGRVLFESADASFANSHVHLAGSVEGIPRSPQLDMVVELERSRLEDLLALERQLWRNLGSFGARGRVDGMLAIQGPWAQRRYGGFLGAREVVLTTPSRRFPLSEIAVRIDDHGARLAPVRVTLAPRVQLSAEGVLERGKLPHYDVALSGRGVPLRDVLNFGRALGFQNLRGLDASGVGTAMFHLSGSAWPFTRPKLTGSAQLRAARLLVPGLNEPLNLPRADLKINGDQIIADPVVAVLGTNVFTARLKHQGARTQPWSFDIKTPALSLEEGALWFAALGRHRTRTLLESFPRLSSSAAASPATGSRVFNSLHARGSFSTSSVTYRGWSLNNWHASVEISGGVLRLDKATFRMGGGRGVAKGLLDLTVQPARAVADVSLVGANLGAWAARLPAPLRRVRGSLGVRGHFETRGLASQEARANFQGQASVRLRDVLLADFDPMQIIARDMDWGTLEPSASHPTIPVIAANLLLHGHHITLQTTSLDLAGAKLALAGSYDVGGSLDLRVRADLRHLHRRWAARGLNGDPAACLGDFRLAGPPGTPVVTPLMQAARVNR